MQPLVTVVAAFTRPPGLAMVLYYALDPGLRAQLGWNAVWPLLWCAGCVFLLGRSLKRRRTRAEFAPHDEAGRSLPGDMAGPPSPF